ncbi:unnamed protein product [Caenorhabditis brenneri]
MNESPRSAGAAARQPTLAAPDAIRTAYGPYGAKMTWHSCATSSSSYFSFVPRCALPITPKKMPPIRNCAPWRSSSICSWIMEICEGSRLKKEHGRQ